MPFRAWGDQCQLPSPIMGSNVIRTMQYPPRCSCAPPARPNCNLCGARLPASAPNSAANAGTRRDLSTRTTCALDAVGKSA